MGEATRLDSRQAFSESLSLIDKIINHTCKRGGLASAEAEDFRSDVYLHLIRDDYSVFRCFKGGSSIQTYLTTVINRLLLDQIIRRRGKWRPCKAAQARGEVGIVLDRLIRRDGWAKEDAYWIARINFGFDISASEFEEIACSFPPRTARASFVPLEEDCVGSWSTLDPEAVQPRCSEISQALEDSLSALVSEEKRLLRMHFKQRLTLAKISRLLGCRYKTLYGRFNRTILKLKLSLERKGIEPGAALEAIGRPEAEIPDFL